MKIYNFGKDMGQEIKAFDSKNLIMTGMIDATDKIRMGCMHVDAGGIVGYHQASVSQLFAVVAGEGVVKGKEDKEYRVKAGYAAYWEEGEWHETRTEAGLTAIVIEGVALNIKMKEEEWQAHCGAN